MPDGWRDEPEASKADIAASDACTRSGAFALALAVVLVLLGVAWKRVPAEDALRQYLDYRFDLMLAVQRLDGDPWWHQYLTLHSINDSVSMAALSVPVPDYLPRSSRAVVIPEVDGIDYLLLKLSDPSLVANAADYSNYFGLQVNLWSGKRMIAIENHIKGLQCSPDASDFFETGPQFRPSFKISNRAILMCLTLGDIRDLSQYQLPTISNPDQIGARINQIIDLSPGSLPRDRLLASIVTESTLLIVILYFWSFTNEARASSKFPVDGTLFGAVSRSKLTLLIMLALFCTPMVAAIYVALVSREIVLIVGALLITLTEISVLTTLLKGLAKRVLSQTRSG